ncbi:MAG TPA: hypothetical protein ENN17_07740 [bacterium]|nr:hypothetical protein [bacterium]
MECACGVFRHLPAQDEVVFRIRIFKGCGLKQYRVLRGGSWNNNPENVRAANRNRNTPDNRNNNRGFRFAKSLECRSSIVYE